MRSKTVLPGLVGLVITSLIFSLAHAQEPIRVLITNVSVWDGVSDRAKPDQAVLIEDNLIARIGNVESDNATVIDGAGLTLMPGIIDAHTHLGLPVGLGRLLNEDPGYLAALSAKAAKSLLMRGWTTVRDMGGPSQGLARAIDEGHIDGPRIYPTAMFISQTSGHGDLRRLTDPHPNRGSGANPQMDRYALLADGPAEVRRAVRESLRQGATAIKVMAGGGVSSAFDPLDTVQYSEEELRAAVEAAADWNTYVAVHAYTDDAVIRSLDAGVKVIEHGHLMSEVGLKRIRADGAFLSSQTFGFARGLLPDPNSKAAPVFEGVDRMMTAAKKLGVPVAFGTDAFGSLQAYEAGITEFGHRLRWFSSLDILKQATSINARLLALTGPRNPYPKGPLGVVKQGAYADLLIVAGDPVADVRVLEDHEKNIRLIMKDGRIYKNTLP